MKEKTNKILIPEMITLSAKLKLETNKSEYNDLRNLALVCRDGKNFVSKISFETKIKNKIDLHNLTYNTLREEFKLPSQISCSIIREVAAQYKSIATKRMKQKHSKPLTMAKFRAKTINLQSKKDFSFKHDTVSIKTLTGRIKVSYKGYNKHIDYINQFGSNGGLLYFDTVKKIVYLIVTVKIPVNFQPLEDLNNFIGIDVGQRKLAVSVNTNTLKTEMYLGKEVLKKKDKYSKKRDELQSKGTRSAKIRLRSISGRERRFIKNVNHCIANSIVEEHSIIGIEDLTNIRENTETKTNKKHSKKKKDANRRKSQWSFFDLQSCIEYKSYLNSSIPVFVDPYKTSQQCPECGFADSGNRKNKGEEFVCLSCNYSADADFVGGVNIGMRARYVKEVFSGRLSIVPNVSDVEVKAWFRLRFQELKL